MAVADEVIVTFEAKLAKYNADLKASTNLFQQAMDKQSASIKRLESQMRASSGTISGQLKGLAGSISTYFTGRELVGLLDSFTRLQNNLRVAGLDGENLKRVQDQLFASAQKYGVELEGLSKLYSSISQSSKELGVSQQDILKLTDSVSASLKVSGISAQEASGALLQLGQALRGGKIQAEEYNSLLDGLYPLLEAAANGSTRWGGSVAKLTADVKSAKVSSQEFFNAILAGSDTLEGKAAKATLTLSSGVTTLGNALTVYFGEADKANGATAALASAMGLLADNLDTLIPAISAIALGLGVGFVANAVRARIAIMALEAASLGAAGAAGTLGVAIGTTGRVLLAAFGGPVGIAITALTIGIGYLISKANEATRASGVYAAAQVGAAKASTAAREAAERLASAHGKTRAEALAAARAEAENTKQKLAGAKASILLAQAELKKAQSFASAQVTASTGSTGVPGTGLFIQGTGDTKVAQARANLKAANDTAASLEKSLAVLQSAISSSGAPKVASVGGGGKKGKGSGSSGPSQSDIAQRFNSALTSLAQQQIAAESDLAKSADERADLELKNVELARIQQEEEIKHNTDYSAAQKSRLSSQLAAAVEAERASIEARRIAQNERDTADLADARYQAQEDALRDEYDMARSMAERRRLALELNDLFYDYKQSVLESIVASQTASDAEKQRAQIELDALAAARQRANDRAKQDTQGPLEKYLSDVSKDANQLNEDFQRVAVDGLQNLNDQLVDAIMNSKNLGDVFKNVAKSIIADLLRIAIQQAVIKPLAESLFSGFGGGASGGTSGSAGGLLAGFTKLFGFASGGYTGNLPRNQVAGVVHGGEYVMNAAAVNRIGVANLAALEAGRGVMRAQSAGGAVSGTIRLELSGDIDARIVNVSGPVAVEVVRAAADPLTEKAVNEMYRRGSRPRT